MKALTRVTPHSPVRIAAAQAQQRHVARPLASMPQMRSRSRTKSPLVTPLIISRSVAVEKVKLIRINGLSEPLLSTTKVNPPQTIIQIPADALPKGLPGDDFWGCGALNYPEKTDPIDDYDTNRTLNAKSFLPGDAPLTHLRKAAYDTRPYKYLWTLDQKGFNFAREMIGFASSRGILLHSKLSPMAVAGGEAWFCPKEDASYINFNSGRYALKNPDAMAVISKLFLHVTKKVYVILPPERYGAVTPVLYERLDAPKAKSGSNRQPVAS